MKFEGSKTEKNLLDAFAKEGMARNKYTFYASKAKKEGFEQISAIFTETAGNEKEHAELWFKALHNGAVPSTLVNLLEAAAGENMEWTQMYKDMAKEARKEGFITIAKQMEGVAKVEQEHEKRYRKLAENLKNHSVFKKDKVVLWKCRNCGHIHIGKSAPKVCPVCGHPQSYFELLAVNY